MTAIRWGCEAPARPSSATTVTVAVPAATAVTRSAGAPPVVISTVAAVSSDDDCDANASGSPSRSSKSEDIGSTRSRPARMARVAGPTAWGTTLPAISTSNDTVSVAPAASVTV